MFFFEWISKLGSQVATAKVDYFETTVGLSGLLLDRWYFGDSNGWDSFEV